MTLVLLTLFVLILWVIRQILVILYRLIWHPLAKFPGPKLASATTAYEFYFDAIKGGQYTFEIGRMHMKYGENLSLYRCAPFTYYSYQGPIVRISPSELHVNDPEFIEELYPGPGKARDKYSYATGQFG